MGQMNPSLFSQNKGKRREEKRERGECRKRKLRERQRGEDKDGRGRKRRREKGKIEGTVALGNDERKKENSLQLSQSKD